MTKRTNYKDFEEFREQILFLSQQNICANEAARKMNIPTSSFSFICKRLKIDFKHKGSNIYKDHNYFDVIDTERKAYILGFILADGCISIEPKKKNGQIYAYSKRLSFCNSIDDLDVLKVIVEEISPNTKLKMLHNQKGAKVRKPQVYIRISSNPICNKLIETFGIKPRKTYDTEFKFPIETIPQHLVRHFIRGMFDGDGWIAKGGNVGFVSTSYNFLLQIGEIFKEQIQSTFKITSTESKNMIYHQLFIYSPLGDNILSLAYKDKKHFKKEYLKDIYGYFMKMQLFFLKENKINLKYA